MAKRRVQYKVDELGVAEVVSALLDRGVSYEEIAAEVEKQTGQAVGKSSIARYNDGLQRRLEKIRRMRESANAIASVIRKENENGEPDMAMEDMLLSVMSQNLLDKGTEDDLETKEITFLAGASAQVVGAKTQMEKLRQTERKRSTKTFDRICKEIRDLMKERAPEALEALEGVLASGREEIVGT